MTGGIKQKICYLQQIDDIDMLDIGLVKKYALNRKMCDLIVFTIQI